MKPRKIITVICILILALFEVYLINDAGNGGYKGSTKFYSYLLVSCFFIVPVALALLIGLYKKFLFHLFIWIFTAFYLIIGISIFYDNLEYPATNPSLVENKIVERYFYKRAPFFTPFSTIFVYNQNLFGTHPSKDPIIKCVYRIGDRKDIKSYYIAKVQLHNNEVEKEIYDQPIMQDTVLFKKEFVKTLKLIRSELEEYKQVEPFLQ
ncbi:hypothetical protein [Ferruginibacter albus]|uniref:hypothetical protein n=1 Tax=Ferruginibacter albus TaxID=2875540 RepID=UPI001CC5A151|nr:hypothetical protein [Ferruginibacter albus]UAY53476.1 hypothetical protein K9M53_07320 [Ferruginibacter albus]